VSEIVVRRGIVVDLDDTQVRIPQVPLDPARVDHDVRMRVRCLDECLLRSRFRYDAVIFLVLETIPIRLFVAWVHAYWNSNRDRLPESYFMADTA